MAKVNKGTVALGWCDNGIDGGDFFPVPEEPVEDPA